MEPIPPFWFKQRQCKIEAAGAENLFKVTGPNLGEVFLRIEPSGERWKAALRLTPNDPDVHATDAEFPDPIKAWEAAFELYRNQLII
jgi:hypothetical protein